MSLLTSHTTTKQQLKFLNKMERHYHKRGGSQYITRQKNIDPPPFTTKISSDTVKKLQQLIGQFMRSVTQIIKQFKTVDHYSVLEILRKHEFFSDVAQHISIDLYAKIQELQQEVLEKDTVLERLRKQMKTQQCEEKLQKIEVNKFNPKYNPSKSIAANIYYHAKAMSQQDFLLYYNKISLSNPIQLKKVQAIDAGKKDAKQSLSKSNLMEKLSSALNCQKNFKNYALVEQLETVLRQQSSQHCKNPCCQYQKQYHDTRTNKAQTLLNTTMMKTNENIYKSDKSEEYFKRYYRNTSFNLQDVISVSKTRMEEMDKIYIEYKKNLKARKKQESHHRYSCSYKKQH